MIDLSTFLLVRMATKEKVKKKKKVQSPAVKRKTKASPLHVPVVNDSRDEEVEPEISQEQDVQGSQVSVRSAVDDNIKDNTVQNGSGRQQASTKSPKASSSDSKKPKKDHVEQKLVKGRGQKESLSDPPRSMSPVTAVQVTKMSTQGSTVSLRSNHSRASKEAWVERSENEVKDAQPSQSSKHSLVSLKDADKSLRENGFKGVSVEVEEDSAEKHAYIPYLYARNCIAKITEDMKAMKTNHIIIVENIQEHYSDIETETQEQFNMFVLCIREEYSKKRNTFRQVIDAHQVELDKKEKYWNEMLTSLAERNNRLLKEKKMLLVHSKTEIERLEREKEELVQQYADEGAHRGALVAAVPQAWEEERKVLHDQLESEKATVASLRSQLASQGPVAMAQVTSGGGGMSDVARVESKQMSAAGAGFSGGALAAAGAMTAARDNKQQMEKERQEIEDERAQFSEDRAKFEEEREMFAAERAQWMGQIAQLQTELGEKSVSGNEWQVKHDIIAGRLAEVGDIQAKYLLLESQYQALAAIVKDTDTSSATKAQLEKNGEEKKMMEGEKASLDKEITQWEKQFEKANKRKPTDDDKPDSIQEMYTTRQEVEYMVTSLEQKEKTLRQVESGSVPDVPDVTHKPVDTKEPEVVTVQVKVPDPSIVEALEKSQGDIIEVRVEVTKLQEHITLLRTEISQQNTQIQTQMTHIAELEHQIASMQAEGVVGGGVMVGGTSVSQEELEKLKEENRNLRRDMKKILKQYERLAQSQADKGVPASVADDDTIATLDNKIADLEAENEALKDERLILREKVKTITETITVTHFEDNKKAVEEKDKRINDLLKELTKLREMNVSMAKDMKKMVKSHMKTKIRMDELINAEKAAKLLEKVAMQVHDIHSEVPPAAVMVNDRLEDSLTRVTSTKLILDNKQAAYQAWLDTYQKKHGKAPGKGDRDALGEDIHDDWEQAKHDYKEAHLLMSALQIMKSGDVSEAVGQDDTESKAEIEIVNLEKALASADNRLLDLEASNKNVINERDRYKEKVEELEKMLEDAGKQIDFNATLLADSQSTAELTEQLGELRKKSDNFEAELMQERMSHVSTRDELETLRKQMDSLKEEMANEKQGLDAKLEASRSEMQAHITLKEEELSAKKARIEQLESEKLSKLPPDTAAEMKALQDKLRELEQDSSSSKSSTATQNAKMAELAAALEVATKNLETIRAHNRELEVKVKAGRHEKDKESKRVSRHMEEKQQKASTEDKQRIQLLVKRVKELENQLGKGVAAAGGVGADKGDVLKLRREIKDQAAEIKRLEKEVRLAGPGGGGGSAKDQVAEKHKTAKQEKVLKEMEKRMDMEKERTAQMMAGLQAADAENSVLKKELEAKEKNVAKLTAELKTIGMAAKEGIEAAAKVKDLQHENKKLGDENVVLTKNFESERVLRKKYYNMVEDMKGKIRVYCRARPMSKTELDRNLIQSAMDGYNVCIFAYGQTGSGKTFTMIGDRDQKYPGVAPRAFNRIFDLGDEMKSKFTLHVETYMMELYNDKLIDLFARPATSEDGAVVKNARNAKELFALFEEGSANRHVASTKMNAESSRSHLIIGIILTSTNKNTGNVTKGKLSLVDLAGSERVAKTQAGAEQLKEAMSINKSLSALGDVISALSSDQQFIPYRNNKLTMLMQDSLGGNAKTLMFVNISPADYNMEETIISKMKKGETLDVDLEEL
ncbi:KN14I-like protein [Mya arenaria]|uniref:KN14I-like protein n=1 Tax=Mya arenaria TaxID=6604 RepID=A0ABY7DUP6_MYAAR|nr:KN14I-like protein [Mya arenaria]